MAIRADIEDAMTADQAMTAEQAATLKRLAKAAYELDAFKPNLTRAEADVRIAALAAKLKLLGEPAAYTLRFASPRCFGGQHSVLVEMTAPHCASSLAGDQRPT